MALTRWWWIRHAPVVGNNGCLYGQTDMSCDCSNRPAFEALARKLPKDAVWLTTPLKRTVMTADAIRAAGLDGPEPVVEPLLIEQNFGEWQGKKYSEVVRHRMWIAAAEHTPPGGENFVEVMARVRRAVERLTLVHAGRDIVAVAHGGTIKAALGLALELPPELALAFSVDNLSLSIMERFSEAGSSHDWRIVTVNQPPH
jgi:alpha-ribazole phosphatase